MRLCGLSISVLYRSWKCCWMKNINIKMHKSTPKYLVYISRLLGIWLDLNPYLNVNYTCFINYVVCKP